MPDHRLGAAGTECLHVVQTLLEFELDVNVDIAAIDVHEKLDLIRGELPADVEDPIIQKFDINAKPMITLALIGDVPLDDSLDVVHAIQQSVHTVPCGRVRDGPMELVWIENDRTFIEANNQSASACH